MPGVIDVAEAEIVAAGRTIALNPQLIGARHHQNVLAVTLARTICICCRSSSQLRPAGVTVDMAAGTSQGTAAGDIASVGSIILPAGDGVHHRSDPGMN